MLNQNGLAEIQAYLQQPISSPPAYVSGAKSTNEYDNPVNNYLREQIEDVKSAMVDLRVQLQANELERMKYQIINENDFTNAPP